MRPAGEGRLPGPVGKGEPGRAAVLDVAVEGQSVGEIAQLPPGHAGQSGIGQESVVPLRGRLLRSPGARLGVRA